MKLIRVETKGFKSFADKTILKFDGGIVGIVGPNGSGKSNINDAIKWVLGESSAKSLRGDNMEDVIFAGSKNMPAMDKAEVSLSFDNSKGRIKNGGREVTITRILKRGAGSNEYYINGEVARKADIQEIAMETGIGKSSLAIISQGTISDIAQATSEQRRSIFEEAAGISKYKKKKKQAMSKLDKTTDALDKIRGIIREQERTLTPLKKQAEKAKLYLEKHAELKEIEIAHIVDDVSFFQSKFDELSEKLEDYYLAKDEISSRIDEIAKSEEIKTQHKLSLDTEIQTLNNQLEVIVEKINKVSMKDAAASERRKLIMEGTIKVTDEAKLQVMKDELQELQTKISQYLTWEEKSRSEIIEKKEIVSKKTSDMQIISNDLSFAKTRFEKAKIKIDVLKEYKNNRSNLHNGVRVIEENKHLFDGYVGIVADLIEVPEQYQTAIELTLSNALQHIVVDKPETAVKGVNFLKTNRSGRATFIPMSSVRSKGLREEHVLVVEGQKGFVGIASDLIKVKSPKVSLLKAFLLGNIIVMDNIENANYVAKILNNRYMIVTLEGDIIRVGGVIAGGQKTKSKDIIGMDEKISKFETLVPEYEKTISQKSSEIMIIKSQIDEENSIIGELNIETAKIIEKRTNYEIQFNNLKASYETKSQKKLELEKTEIETDSIELIESERSSLKALKNAKRESIVTINQDLSSMSIEKNQLEKTLREMMEESQQQVTDKNQAEYIIKSHKQRLSEEYELTVEAATGLYSSNLDREKAAEIVSNLRHEIKSLGHVNVDAIEQFEELNERFTKFKNSEKELFSAQQTILSAINEMDQIIITKFKDTVDNVNAEVGNIFRTMFGGGDAFLKYTDKGNMLETGIDVIAQPPGKTVKNLKLFSGGEKALVAISLLFAILKTKPLPLCLLDEVEAALDDANVVRYAEFLKELKDKTQFIVVTHRVGTMSRVDHLFGATMQHRGVTSFYTVALSQAKKLIEES